MRARKKEYMNNNLAFIENLLVNNEELIIKQEHLSSNEYIEFLARTDLGQQYPKEDFRNRIETLVNNVQISLIVRTKYNKIIGTCFGITDFAYWLLITDLGIDREYIKKGIGKKLMETARQLAGGNDKIIVFTYANEDAIEFYSKIGMKHSKDMMELTNVKWTEFEVGKDEIG